MTIAVDAELKKEIDRRGITRACHFTQSRKMAHILADPLGIRCNVDLEGEAADVFDANDKLRLDGKEDHISCSIEYPNHWVMNQMKGREPIFADWAILLLHPSVLWRKTTLYSTGNAASSSKRTGMAGLTPLFEDRVRDRRGRVFDRTAKMFPFCPTNDQAEAMVYGGIARELLLGVVVSSHEQAQLEHDRLSLCPGMPEVKWIVAPSFFNGDWSRMVRQGRRPKETIVTFEPDDS